MNIKGLNFIPVIKKSSPVFVRFASEPECIETLEGSIFCAIGDAILTSQLGESWPIERRKFLLSYEPIPPTKLRQSGHYRKKYKVVQAAQLDQKIAVSLANERGILYGEPGDWLLIYANDEYGVVNQAIFEQQYQGAAS